jgi:hypothetical protein
MPLRANGAIGRGRPSQAAAALWARGEILADLGKPVDALRDLDRVASSGSVRVDPPHEGIARRLIDRGRRQPPI